MLKHLPFLVLFTIISCNSTEDSSESENAILAQNEEIKDALDHMLERTNEDAFVIFESPDGDKYVQFAGNADHDLYFSLPAVQMTEAEVDKAATVLSAYDIVMESSPMYANEYEKEPSGSMDEFSKTLGKDTKLAAELVSRVMIDVFGMSPDVTLTIIEN